VYFLLGLHWYPALTYSTSITASQVSLGRRIRRTVDMFYTSRDLVEEHDRRLDIIIVADESHEFTSE